MTGRRSFAAAAIAAALVAGCAAPGGSQGAGDGRAEGVVRVVGSTPVDVQVLVEDEDGTGVRVVGPLRDELGRLHGAQVVVLGRLGESSEPVADRQIEASDYEIVSIGGEPVIQGVIQGRTAGWTVLRTRDGETLYLASVPDSVRTGRTIWVKGQRGLVVQSFGVLRE